MSSDLIKLDSNENQINHSFDVNECISEVNPKLYPEVTNDNVKRSIANYFGVSKEEVFCSHGSDYLIKVLTFGLVRGDSEVIMPAVAFPTYEIAAKIKECKYVKIPLKDYGIDLNSTLDAINDKTALVWISNPHNPTGTLLTDDEIIRFLDKVPSRVKIVLDEAYIEFLEKDPLDSIKIYRKYSNVIILRTFSKAYGLAGVRIGYGIATPKIINEFNFVIGPFDLNCYGQALAVKAIKEQDYVNKVKHENLRALKMFEDAFDSMGLEYIKSYASFIVLKLKGKASQLTEYLKSKDIMVKDGKFIGVEDCIRISMGNEKQNKIVINEIKNYLCLEGM